MPENSSHDKGLFKVMVIGTSLSFGLLGAIIMSMRNFFAGNAQFEFTYKTVIGFVAGAALGWGFWRIIRNRIGDSNRR